VSPGLIPFMTARLNEDEAAANAMQHFTFCPAARPAPHSGSCDCGLAARKGRALREVEAKRARLALFDWAVTEVDRLLADDDAEKISQGAAIGCCEAARTGVKLDAGVYSGHPDYRKVWDR
jgi:hypothetical protein